MATELQSDHDTIVLAYIGAYLSGQHDIASRLASQIDEMGEERPHHDHFNQRTLISVYAGVYVINWDQNTVAYESL